MTGPKFFAVYAVADTRDECQKKVDATLEPINPLSLMVVPAVVLDNEAELHDALVVSRGAVVRAFIEAVSAR